MAMAAAAAIVVMLTGVSPFSRADGTDQLCVPALLTGPFTDFATPSVSAGRSMSAGYGLRDDPEYLFMTSPPVSRPRGQPRPTPSTVRRGRRLGGRKCVEYLGDQRRDAATIEFGRSAADASEHLETRTRCAVTPRDGNDRATEG
jgi:hypothetical protein